jgi:hypothetical protein
VRIHRSRPDGHFAQIPNGVLRDERLSYAARGVLCELLSRPDGWDTSADQMSGDARANGRTRRGEGRRAMRGAYAELEAAGYLWRERTRDERGRFTTAIHVSDQPRRGTASGTPAPSGETADSGCLPSSDRRTAHGPSVSGTFNRTQSTNTENLKDGPSPDLASRRARAASRTSARRDLPAIIHDVKAATARVYGDREAVILTDEEALGLYFTLTKTDKARAGIRDLAAYMAGIFESAPYMDSFIANSEAVCVTCVNWESDCSCDATAGQPAPAA